MVTILQIGQAMRIALSLGMNHESTTGYLDHGEYQRRRRLWWTLYVVDKKLSTIIGTPSSIEDQEINISLPEVHDLDLSNSALNYHIKLSVLEGKVMSGTSMQYLATSRPDADYSGSCL